ncbi:MAG: tetratricopeptide repeat protein [Oligoflexales bacterium]|nr:tetratricopeptide repeat protein [Oligoflexales bacterium]
MPHLRLLCLTCTVYTALSAVPVFASKKLNNDVVTGRLVPPGPWEFFIYETVDRVGTLDADSIDQTLEELSSSISNDGSAKDAETVIAYASANFDRFVLDYHAHVAEFKKSFWSWQNSGKKGERPVFKLGDEKLYLQKALISYRRLVFDFPKEKRTDDLYLNLSLILSLSRNQNKIIYLKKLLKEFPKSPLKEQAFLQFANAYFDKKKIGSAFKYYKRLQRSANNKIRLYARYMVSWIHYYKSKRKASVFAKKLQEVARIGLIQGSKSGAFVTEQILSDLVKIWDKDEYLPRAEDFFNRVQRYDYYLFLLERVAKRNIKLKRFDQAIETYKKIISGSTIKKNNPMIHGTILDIYMRRRKYTQVVATFLQMEKLYLKGSAWTSANKNQVPAVKILMEKSLKKYALVLSKQIKSEPSLVKPLTLLFEMYLRWFPKTKAATSMRLKLAQLQSNGKQHIKSAANYKQLSEDAGKNKKLKYNAFKFAILEMSKAIELTKPPKPTLPHPLAQPSVYLQIIKDYVAYLSEYIKEYNKNEIDTNYRYRLAETQYTYGYYKEAIAIWNSIIDKFPDSKWAQASIKSINLFYVTSNNWREVNRFGYQLVASKKIKDNKVLAEVIQSIRTASFTLAKQQVAQNSLQTALSVYMEYHKTFPKEQEADLALYESFLIAGKLGNTVLQVDLGQKFIKAYQASKLLAEVLMNMGIIFGNLIEVEKAALYLSNFVSRFPKHAKVPDSYMSIGRYYTASGNPDKAALIYLTFARTFPSHQRVKEAFSEAIRITKDLGNKQVLFNVLSVYQTNPQAKDPSTQLLANAINAVETRQNVDTVITQVAGAPVGARKEASELLSKSIVSSIRAYVSNESQSELNISPGIDALSKQKKSQFKLIEDLHKKIVRMGHPDYLLESHYYMAVLFYTYSRKLIPMIKAADEKNKIKIENAAFEAQEIAESYFEFINEAVKRNISLQQKIVYQGMGIYKKNYPLPREVLLKPIFATYSPN